MAPILDFTRNFLKISENKLIKLFLYTSGFYLFVCFPNLFGYSTRAPVLLVCFSTRRAFIQKALVSAGAEYCVPLRPGQTAATVRAAARPLESSDLGTRSAAAKAAAGSNRALAHNDTIVQG